jgi:hypothetical protein
LPRLRNTDVNFILILFETKGIVKINTFGKDFSNNAVAVATAIIRSSVIEI